MKISEVGKEITEISVKTLLSVIPVGGPLITNIWDSIKGNCVQKRLADWQEIIENRLSNIDASLEDVGANENFTTAMLVATELAIKTSEREKREYLANAVVSSYTDTIDESIEMIFFDLIGKYTCWHLRILDYFEDPKKFKVANNVQVRMGSPKTVLYMQYPELESNDKLVDKLIKEMYADGLINTEDMNCTMTSQGMLAPRVTDLGKQFIKFISNSEK